MPDLSGLNPDFYGNLQRFMAAAPQPLSILSAYRSPQRQAELWQGALAKYGSPEAARKWVAPPGHSMHNQGEAVDLGFGSGHLGSGNQELINWAHQNAGNYGLTFPLANENWHIEPMGARASNNTTTPVPQSGQAALMAPAGSGSGGQQAMLPPLLQPPASGDGYSMASMLGEGFKPMRDAMTAFNQGYSADRFMSDMLGGGNPMRNLVFGALGSLFRA